MDNQDLTGHRNDQTAILLRSQKQPQRLRVMQLLTVLAEARQAAVSPQTLELYSSELARHQAEDIDAAVRKLMYCRREQGETAFPDLATLDEEIRGFAKMRRQNLAREFEHRQQEAEAQRRMEHPEDYVPVRDIWAEFMEKRAAAPPSMRRMNASCPHCNGVELKNLKPADLRALAEVIEKQQEAGNAENAG